MAYMEFFGCLFLAFGPPLCMFIITVAKDPIRVIVLMTSAFFWLCSLFLSSLWWFAVVPLRENYEFALFFSVVIQEVFRFLFYILMKKAEKGLIKIQKEEHKAVVFDRRVIAYVSGFGFGVISGVFSFVNVLSNMTGPAAFGLYGGSQAFFLVSALLTLCFIFLHTCWSIIMYLSISANSINSVRLWLGVCAVVASHFLVSGISLLNSEKSPEYYAVTVIITYATLAVNAAYSIYLVRRTFIGSVLS